MSHNSAEGKGENLMTAAAENAKPPVLVVMGVSGSGKSTLAEHLAAELGWSMGEGDDLHPEANVAKMAAGHPLTDEDRWPWLDRVRAWIDARIEAGEPGVITCSALRRVYRDRLRAPEVVFVHLTGSAATIADRMRRRKGHYMPASLLQSQFDTLEPLEPDERGILVDVAETPTKESDEVISRLGLHAITR